VAGDKKIPWAGGSSIRVGFVFGVFPCPFFEMAESGKTEIPIGEIDPQILELVVQSCYLPEFSISSPEILFKVFEAVQRFQMPELSKFCLDFQHPHHQLHRPC
jgi:hypothetical protein